MLKDSNISLPLLDKMEAAGSREFPICLPTNPSPSSVAANLIWNLRVAWKSCALN